MMSLFLGSSSHFRRETTLGYVPDLHPTWGASRIAPAVWESEWRLAKRAGRLKILVNLQKVWTLEGGGVGCRAFRH